MPQVETCDFLDFVQPVDQGVSMDKELFGGLGGIEVVREKRLGCLDQFRIGEKVRRTFQDLLREGTAHGERHSADQTR